MPPAADNAPDPAVHDAVEEVAEVEPELGSTEASDETGLEDIAPATDEPAAPNWEERVTGWGGEENISEALKLQEALGTREGVQALFDEAARYLGVGQDKIAELLGQTAPDAAPDPVRDLLGDDPDRLMTAAEVAEVVQKIVQEQAVAPLQAQAQAQVQQQIRANVDAAAASLAITDEADRSEVFAYADKYISSEEDMLDPSKVQSAIQRGYADWEARTAAKAKAYLESKKQQKDEAPTPLKGGTTAGGEDAVEPQTLAEAKARVRKAIGA